MRRSYKKQLAGLLSFLSLAGVASAQSGGPVQVGDLAFGLSRSTATETAQRVTACGLNGGWSQVTFLQSMEFDNLDGVRHSACGNLLSLNFGTTAGGGSLYTLATNGTENATLVYAFDPASETGVTRVGGLSVSPNNSRIALMSYDYGNLIIMDYAAGNGDGTGASVSAPLTVTFVGSSASTQGTAWYNNNKVLAYVVDADAGDTKLRVIDANTGAIDQSISVSVRTLASNFTDVEFNPDLSPYIYCLHSSFSTATQNTLTVIDSSNFNIVKQVILDTSMNTGREIALGADGNLYMAQFGGSSAPGPFVDTISSNPASMSDNGSIDCYQAVGISSSFNGIDVATGSCAPADFALEDPVPGVAGTQNTFTAVNAEPGARIYFVYGFQSGSTNVPGCPGLVVDIRNPQVAGSAVADGSGVATFRSPVPGSASGDTFRIQAVDTQNCDTTNLVIWTF